MKVGMTGYGGSRLNMVAMLQALAMGMSPDSIVNAAIPNGPYQPKEDYPTDEEVQSLVHSAEAKRQRKNAKRLANWKS